MFGKKQPARAPWSVQLLTTDYLISGHLDGDSTGATFLHVQKEKLAWAMLTLTDAQCEATAGLAAPPALVPEWVLTNMAQFVALLPRDEGSLAYCAKKNNSSNHPFAAEVYVGPYVLRGTLLSTDTSLDFLADYATFVMQTVVIDSLAPGARLRGLAAPYVIVRSLLLHGIVPEA